MKKYNKIICNIISLPAAVELLAFYFVYKYMGWIWLIIAIILDILGFWAANKEVDNE